MSSRDAASTGARDRPGWRRTLAGYGAAVAAALAAGMRVIAITNTHPAEELRAATCVARSYEEIGRLLIPAVPGQ